MKKEKRRGLIEVDVFQKEMELYNNTFIIDEAYVYFEARRPSGKILSNLMLQYFSSFNDFKPRTEEDRFREVEEYFESLPDVA